MMASTKGLRNTAARLAYAIVAVLFFASCHHEIMLDTNKVCLYPVVSSQIEAQVSTRALNGYSPYTVEDDKYIHAYCVAYNNEDGTRNQEKDVRGIFSRTATGWRSTVNAVEGCKYQLFAHNALPGATGLTFNYAGAANVSLQFSGLSIFADYDPLICVASAGKTLLDNPPISDYPELTKDNYDQFLVETRTIDNVGSASTKVFMAMDHLMAKATVSFQVDDTYSQIRKIKITDCQIIAANGTLEGSHNYNFMTSTLTPASWTPSGSSKSIDIMGGASATFQDTDNDGGMILTTDAKEMGWFCFLPLNGRAPSLTLSVTYNVYDLKGNCTRSEQTTQNINLLGRVNSPAAGNNYHVKVTVAPTYLYVLSDDDVEFKLDIE